MKIQKFDQLNEGLYDKDIINLKTIEYTLYCKYKNDYTGNTAMAGKTVQIVTTKSFDSCLEWYHRHKYIFKHDRFFEKMFIVKKSLKQDVIDENKIEELLKQKDFNE